MLQILQKFTMVLSAFIRRHPRLPRLIILRSLAASFALGGCVPSTTYEQAQSAAEVEREGHRRTVVRLEAIETELAREKAEKAKLTAQKADLERRLLSGESEIAQVSLERENSQKASEQQTELVTQLRGELARVGVHLKEFEGDKQELGDQLSETRTLLAAKEQQIALLETQIARLQKDEEKSADAQQQLSGALEDLDKLQRDTQAAPAEEKSVDEEGVEEDGADDAASDDVVSDDVESEDDTSDGVESEEPSAEEVLPSDEG